MVCAISRHRPPRYHKLCAGPVSGLASAVFGAPSREAFAVAWPVGPNSESLVTVAGAASADESSPNFPFHLPYGKHLARAGWCAMRPCGVKRRVAVRKSPQLPRLLVFRISPALLHTVAVVSHRLYRTRSHAWMLAKWFCG